MKARRALHGSRILVALLTMAAWFVASDHCVIASSVARGAVASAKHDSCSGHSAPQKKEGNKVMPCCRSLVALAVAPVKNVAFYDSTLVAAQTYPPAEDLPAVQISGSPMIELDTGPPGCFSFAESVLQRSLRAHAPPSLV